MNNNTYFMKHGAAAETYAPFYRIWSLQDAAVFSQRTAGLSILALCRDAELYRFARQYLYRLIVSRLARAEVIMSGALTSIDVL